MSSSVILFRVSLYCLNRCEIAGQISDRELSQIFDAPEYRKIQRIDPSTANPRIESGKDALYTVFRVNREIQNASNIGIIGANRNYDGKNKGSVGLVATLFFTRV